MEWKNLTCFFLLLLVLGVTLSRLRFPIYHIRCSSSRTELIKPDRAKKTKTSWFLLEYLYLCVDPCRQLRRSCCLKRKMSSICLLWPDKTTPFAGWLGGEVRRVEIESRAKNQCHATHFIPQHFAYQQWNCSCSTMIFRPSPKKTNQLNGYRFDSRILKGDKWQVLWKCLFFLLFKVTYF